MLGQLAYLPNSLKRTESVATNPSCFPLTVAGPRRFCTGFPLREAHGGFEPTATIELSKSQGTVRARAPISQGRGSLTISKYLLNLSVNVSIRVILASSPQTLVFDTEGNLPPGDYAMTIDDLRQSVLVQRTDEARPSWDAQWRRTLADNLERLCGHL